MGNPAISNLGSAQSLRPSGSGWDCVFSQVVAQAPPNTPVYAERQGFSYFEILGNSFPWSSQLSPQDVANGLRANGHPVYYMEIWENAGGVVGNDQFIYISVYG